MRNNAQLGWLLFLVALVGATREKRETIEDICPYVEFLSDGLPDPTLSRRAGCKEGSMVMCPWRPPVCMKVFDSKSGKSFKEAKAECKRFDHMHLVSLITANQRDFYRGIASANFGNGDNDDSWMWVGAKRKRDRKDFEWIHEKLPFAFRMITKEKLTYNTTIAPGDCVAMHASLGVLYAADCTARFSYACIRPADPSKAPIDHTGSTPHPSFTGSTDPSGHTGSHTPSRHTASHIPLDHSSTPDPSGHTGSTNPSRHTASHIPSDHTRTPDPWPTHSTTDHDPSGHSTTTGHWPTTTDPGIGECNKTQPDCTEDCARQCLLSTRCLPGWCLSPKYESCFKVYAEFADGYEYSLAKATCDGHSVVNEDKYRSEWNCDDCMTASLIGGHQPIVYAHGRPVVDDPLFIASLISNDRACVSGSRKERKDDDFLGFTWTDKPVIHKAKGEDEEAEEYLAISGKIGCNDFGAVEPVQKDKKLGYVVCQMPGLPPKGWKKPGKKDEDE